LSVAEIGRRTQHLPQERERVRPLHGGREFGERGLGWEGENA
jgi:hypothetical protein